MQDFLRNSLLTLPLFAAAGLLFGLAYDEVALSLLLALLVYVAALLSRLHRLHRQMRKTAAAEWSRGGGEDDAAFDSSLLEKAEGGRGLVVTRDNGDIVWFNRAAAALLGLKAEQDRGADIVHLIRNPDFVRCFTGGHFGRTVAMHSPAAPAAGVCVLPGGRGRRLILVDDLSRLQKLETMNRDLIGNVSHELRSPLTVIVGYLDMLDEICGRGDDRRLDAALTSMRRQSARMQQIVSDLLELSELEVEPPGERRAEVVSVAELVAAIRDEARELDPSGRCRIVADIGGLGIRGSRARLQSAFFNLVSNAVRYSPDGGTITLRWRGDESGARFCVADEGVGIESYHLPRLTERFYRVDKDRSRTTGGTGLGLAIVKHILNHHDAELEVQSAPGKGSVFCCRFPASRVAAPRA